MSKSVEERIDKLESSINEIKTLLMNNKSICNENYKDDYEYNHPEPTKLIDNRLTEKESNKIEDILVNFNFDKVHRVMKFLDWSWMHGIPSMEDLKSEAKRLLIDATVERTTIATGGFRAVYDNGGDEDDTDPYIGLEFIIEETEGFDEESDD